MVIRSYSLSMLLVFKRMMLLCASRSKIWRVLVELYIFWGLNNSEMNFSLNIVEITSCNTVNSTQGTIESNTQIKQHAIITAAGPEAYASLCGHSAPATQHE